METCQNLDANFTDIFFNANFKHTKKKEYDRQKFWGGGEECALNELSQQGISIKSGGSDREFLTTNM